MSDEQPPAPFALGMYSVSNSPAFPTLVFDDRAAVALEALSALITRLNLSPTRSSVFDLVRHWDRTLPQLVDLVQMLACSGDAAGHRAAFQSEDFLTAERLRPEARQIYRLRKGDASLIPTPAQGAAEGRSRLDDKRNAAPGSLFLGPLIVPAVFGGDPYGTKYLLALMTNPAQRGDFGELARARPDRIAGLGQDALLLLGDVIVVGADPAEDAPEAESIDVVEAAAAGFGRQIISTQ